MSNNNPDTINYNFYPSDAELLIKELGKKNLKQIYTRMLLIRHFETRAESAYLQGHIGGFFHAYMGQEAIQTAAIEACGEDNWWSTSYRCHALALLLGATPKEIMAELYGKETGNTQGRGGSMHLYTDRLLGGFGIVGGQLPVAAGAALSLKQQKNTNEMSLCFLGDGACAQGVFHESLNLAALWDLPIVYVIENNKWGMGTSVQRAISVAPIAENFAKSYGMKSYTINGMDFFNCYAAFQEIKKEVLQSQRPVLVEAITERFRGHSISDPANYRSKEDLKVIMSKGPLHILKEHLINSSILSEEECSKIDQAQKEIVLESMKFAEESPWPDPIVLEEDVFAE